MACGGDGTGSTGGDLAEGQPPVGTAFFFDNLDATDKMLFVDSHQSLMGDTWIRPFVDPGVSDDGSRLVWTEHPELVKYVVKMTDVLPGGALGDTWEFNIGTAPMQGYRVGPYRHRFIGHDGGRWHWFDRDTDYHAVLSSGTGDLRSDLTGGAAWSPDGLHHAIWEDRANLTLYRGSARLLAIPYGYQGVVDVGNFPRVSFSPNGEWAAFAYYREEYETGQYQDFTGVQFYHIPRGMGTDQRVSDAVRDYGFAKMHSSPVYGRGNYIPLPWTPDSRALITNPYQLQMLMEGTCYSEYELAPLYLLQVEESIAAGEDVVVEVALDDGTFKQEQDCVSRKVLDVLPGENALLYEIRRYQRVIDPISHEYVYLDVETQFRRLNLSDHSWETLAYKLRTDPSLDQSVEYREIGWCGIARTNTGHFPLAAGGAVAVTETGACSGEVVSPDGCFCGFVAVDGRFTAQSIIDPTFTVEAEMNTNDAHLVYEWR